VPVGRRTNGGYSGELDVAGCNFRTGHLIHIECSLDCDSKSQREVRFAKKFAAGRSYIKDVFPGISLPEELDQKLVLQYPSANITAIAGASVVSVRELIHEILDGMRDKSPARGAVASTLPLLRTVQQTADAVGKGSIGPARIIPQTLGLHLAPQH
jgi:hypothetical protein